jgi:hypothetical protein
MLATGMAGPGVEREPVSTGVEELVCATISAFAPASVARRALSTFWQPVLLPVTIAIQSVGGAPR